MKNIDNDNAGNKATHGHLDDRKESKMRRRLRIGNSREGEGYSFFNEDNEEICRPYENLWKFFRGRALAMEKGQLFFIDEEGKEVGPRFDYITTTGRIPVQQRPRGGAEAFFNEGQKFRAYKGFLNELAIIFIDGKQGVIDCKGNLIAGCQYDEVCIDTPKTSHFIPVSKAGKWGYIDRRTGEEVTLLAYDKSTKWTELTSCTRLSKNGKYGIVDQNGYELTDFYFDHIKPFSSGMAVVRIGRKFGYLRQDNFTLATEVKFDSAYPFINGYGEVTIQGLLAIKRRYVDKEDWLES
jgi:hypothetical protein